MPRMVQKVTKIERAKKIEGVNDLERERREI